jgi:hypothetical protein
MAVCAGFGVSIAFLPPITAVSTAQQDTIFWFDQVMTVNSRTFDGTVAASSVALSAAAGGWSML